LACNLLANFSEAIATFDKILRGYWQLCANIENTHPWLEVCQYPLILARGYSLSSEAVDRVLDNLGRHYQKGAPFINKEAIFSDLYLKRSEVFLLFSLSKRAIYNLFHSNMGLSF
jgi:hypothetical protein